MLIWLVEAHPSVVSASNANAIPFYLFFCEGLAILHYWTLLMLIRANHIFLNVLLCLWHIILPWVVLTEIIAMRNAMK
jgi:hypothetical protein